jgi:hypothetical protein
MAFSFASLEATPPEKGVFHEIPFTIGGLNCLAHRPSGGQ